MSNSKTFSYILIFLLVLAAIFAGYKFFIAGDEEGDGGIVVSSDAGAEGQSTGDEFVDLLNSLKDVEFNSDSFAKNPILNENGLRDFSVTLPSVEMGRPNPFASIGIGGGVTVKSQATSTKKVSAPKSTTPAAVESENTASEEESGSVDFGDTESQF